MAVTQDKVELFTQNDWKTDVSKPTWCPGCGDFGVLSATRKALVELQVDPTNTLVISGIGCSSNFPHFIGGYGIHSLHGRAAANAVGAKLSNPDLTVIVAGGDGDGLGIGLGGLVHAARRNLDVTYVIMDNQIYGLTTGQTSPTSLLGAKTKSTPYGNIERPLNPIAIALAAEATFIARTFSGDGKHFAEVMKRAIAHKGFSIVDALSPCVTFNKFNTYDYFRERVYRLEDTDYDPSDKMAAYKKAYEWEVEDKVPIGVFYEVERPTYEDQELAYKEFGNPVKRGPQRPANFNQIIQDHY